MACIFCRIVSGEAPAEILVADGLTRAILDVNPVTAGHALVIPKKHYADIGDLPDEDAKHSMALARRLALAYRKRGIPAINLLNASEKEAQQSVFHLHVIPRRADDGLDLWFHGKGNGAADRKDFASKVKGCL